MESEDANNKDTCEGCRKLSISCTYDYVKKKPGRKNSSVSHTAIRQVLTVPPSYAIALKAAQAHPEDLNGWARNGHQVGDTMPHRSPFTSHTPFSPYHTDSVRSTSHFPGISPTATQNDRLMPMLSGGIDGFDTSPGFMTPGRPWSSFTFSPRARNTTLPTTSDAELTGMDWLDSLLEGTLAGSLGTAVPSAGDIDLSNIDLSLPFPNTFPSDQAHLLALESPENLALSTTSSGQMLGRSVLGLKREPQLEDVSSWANISHFISLFLQYLYPLLPLVHRPTFAENLATRRDLRDTDFRALLLSIGELRRTYADCSRLCHISTPHQSFDQRAFRHRGAQATPETMSQNLQGAPEDVLWPDEPDSDHHDHIVSAQLGRADPSDTFYLLSIGLGHTAGSRLGQAVQLAFSMGMHSDDKTNTLGLDAIEIELRRRVFWQLYASDK